MLATLLTLLPLGLVPVAPLQPALQDDPQPQTETLDSADADQDPESEPEEDKEPKVDAGLLSAFSFRSIGPALMSGRIADIAIDPVAPNTWYVAAGSGGLWKTTNAGTTFKPIFDSYGSYSIGCVTIDPTDHNRIWVGSGEAVGGRHVGFGDGVYLSEDGGQSFRNMGLKESEHVAKIIVDPSDRNTVFVAAQGPLWSAGGERGLYRTKDGGTTWEQVLADGPYTGVTDIVLDPRDPQVMYAATHQRMRTVWALLDGGPESGIHKSLDGGSTWKKLKKGLPGGDKGKIGLAIAPEAPDTVYATIELAGPSGGFWRSDNGGASWNKQSDYVGGGTGPHYYQELWADPHHARTIYQANVQLGRSVDGGKTWGNVSRSSKHVDNHAVAFRPDDPEFLLVGCDGGLYVSHDRGQSYRFFDNLPLTQFYKVDVDYDWPVYHIVGGTQDNSTQYGPSRTLNRHGIRNSDWKVIIGGDGHDNAIDPSNPDLIYGESQEGFIQRYDRRSGETITVRPQPGPGEDNLRFNWDSPIFISPHDSARIYFASNRLHRSDDHGESWTVVSPDLSRQQDRLKLKIMDRYWGLDALWDLRAMSMYGNITSISESPLVEGLLYLGTDDGRVAVSEDDGASWRTIDQVGEVPPTAFINDIKADNFDADTVYVALDNHKVGDFKPYLMKSTDRGRSWTSLVADLPERTIVWRLVQDHELPRLLFLGTEFGVYCTLDAGEHWLAMQSGMPKIAVRDLAIQKRENDLVAATFGRSFYVLDNYAPMRVLSEKLLQEEIAYLPIKDALLYVPRNELGGRVGSQGDAYYTANNPERGAVIRYWLKEGLKSAKSLRKEAEREEDKASETKEGRPYPGWEVLREEQQDEGPKLYFEIRNEAGDLVQRMSGSSGKGLQKLTWNLRRAGGGAGGRGMGPYVPGGLYTVQAIRAEDGVNQAWGPAVSFSVNELFESTLPRMAPEALLAWVEELDAFSNVVSASLQSLDTALEDVRAMKRAVRQGQQAPLELGDRLRAMELSLVEMRRGIAGGDIREDYHHEGAPSIQGRLSGARWGSIGGTHGPTGTMQEQAAIARQEFEALYPELKHQLEVVVPAMKKEVDAAGVGWTQGRALPELPR